MVDVEQICWENDDSAEVADPQYELFFESLKKHDKSYVLEGKIDDVFVCVKYEEENKSGRKREPKCGRKRKIDIGRVDAAADQSRRLPNEQAPADQNRRLPNEQAPADQHVSDNFNDRRNEISKKKPDLRNKGIIKESDVGFSQDQSTCKVSKNMTFLQKGNNVTDNQSEPHGRARLRKADEGENVAKAHYVPDSESVIWISCDRNQYQSPVSRNNSVSNKQSELRGQAQPIKREKGLKGKNVVLGKHNPDTENHFLKPDPKHNLATKYQVDRANQVVPSEEDKEVQSKKKFPKVMEEKNVVTDDCVANRKALNYRDNEPLHPELSPQKNLEEHQHKDVDQTQPGKKQKVQSQGKLKKVVHGSFEIKVDDAASRNVAQTKDKPLFHKSRPRKYQVTKACIDEARPKQSHNLVMKEIEIMDDSDAGIAILDSASFCRAGNPDSFMTPKKFHKSVIEDDDIELLGRASPRFHFRKQIMNVLRKPYDKQECERLQALFMAGSYVKFHPVLVKKLSALRHKKGKCLAILRGFFFWIENLTQEGSFKPWEDKECLRVDPTLL